MLIRGVPELLKYMKKEGAKMSQSTVYNLMREREIPHFKPVRGINIFDTDKIDAWLRGDWKGEEDDFNNKNKRSDSTTSSKTRLRVVK